MKRIVLDIGHGSNTFPPSKGVYLKEGGLSAAPTVNAFEEHTFNSLIGEKAAAKLKEYEVDVLFTQAPNADDIPLEKRVRRVAELQKTGAIDLLISLHANAHYVNSPARGYESYHWIGDDFGRAFCELWHRHMKNTGMVDRGVKVSSQYKNGWYIVRKSPCPAVLLEHFFYTNYDELMKFTGPEWVEVLADNLVKTIVEILGLKKKQKQEQKETLTVNIDGLDREMDFVNIDGRNFVSIREIAESLGAVVEWDNVNKKVMIMKGE